MTVLSIIELVSNRKTYIIYSDVIVSPFCDVMLSKKAQSLISSNFRVHPVRVDRSVIREYQVRRYKNCFNSQRYLLYRSLDNKFHQQLQLGCFMPAYFCYRQRSWNSFRIFAKSWRFFSCRQGETGPRGQAGDSGEKVCKIDLLTFLEYIPYALICQNMHNNSHKHIYALVMAHVCMCWFTTSGTGGAWWLQGWARSSGRQRREGREGTSRGRRRNRPQGIPTYYMVVNSMCLSFVTVPVKPMHVVLTLPKMWLFSGRSRSTRWDGSGGSTRREGEYSGPCVETDLSAAKMVSSSVYPVKWRPVWPRRSVVRRSSICIEQ